MRFGIAQLEFGPPVSTLMHGYGFRRDCFDGKHDPLT